MINITILTPHPAPIPALVPVVRPLLGRISGGVVGGGVLADDVVPMMMLELVLVVKLEKRFHDMEVKRLVFTLLAVIEVDPTGSVHQLSRTSRLSGPYLHFS